MLTTFLHEALGWIGVFLHLAGLVVCLVYLRISSAMFLMVAAFSGFVAAGIGGRVAMFAAQMQMLPGEVLSMLYVVTHAINMASTAALVVGLYAVFRDLRDRFHFLREAHEEQRLGESSR